MLRVNRIEYQFPKPSSLQAVATQLLDGETQPQSRIAMTARSDAYSIFDAKVIMSHEPAKLSRYSTNEDRVLFDLPEALRTVEATQSAQWLGQTLLDFRRDKRTQIGVFLIPDSETVKFIPVHHTSTITQTELNVGKKLFDKRAQLLDHTALPKSIFVDDADPQCTGIKNKSPIIRKLSKYLGQSVVDVSYSLDDELISTTAPMLPTNDQVAEKLNHVATLLGGGQTFGVAEIEEFSADHYTNMAKSGNYELPAVGLNTYFHDPFAHGMNLLIPGAQKLMDEVIAIGSGLDDVMIGKQLHIVQHYLSEIDYVQRDRYSRYIPKKEINDLAKKLSVEFMLPDNYDGVYVPFIRTFYANIASMHSMLDSLIEEENNGY